MCMHVYALMGWLTLKATGSECGFIRRRVCDTSCWKGPAWLSISAYPQCGHLSLTLEPKFYGIELDGHGGCGRGVSMQQLVCW
jgi:hypothetical protein